MIEEGGLILRVGRVRGLGGIGRRARLRILCPKDVWVQVPQPPDFALRGLGRRVSSGQATSVRRCLAEATRREGGLAFADDILQL